jgi:hypothetical protein
VAVFVPDLMDRSKVEAVARANGVALEAVSSPDDLLDAVERGAEMVIVDLGRPRVLEALGSLGAVRTVGFASHVNRDLIRDAATAGCRSVMARSAFFRRLPSLLGGSGAGPGGPGAEQGSGRAGDGQGSGELAKGKARGELTASAGEPTKLS